MLVLWGQRFIAPIEHAGSYLAWPPASTSIMVGITRHGTNVLRENTRISALYRTDIAILGLLQNNARLSVEEIAAEIGLAPSSTQRP